MKNTKIQWCHSTINPVMGCDGCELWPSATKIITSLLAQLVRLTALSEESIRPELARVFEDRATGEVYREREEIAGKLSRKFSLDRAAWEQLVDVIRGACKCYAGLLGTNRAGHAGYADAFETPKLFPGRMAEAAKWKPPTPKEVEDRLWLAGLPRLIFISDMGDALSKGIPFDFLDREIIGAANSDLGQRHIWLWLTKRPGRMARFGQFLANRSTSWPDNLVAMTTVTAQANASRIAALRKVPSRFKGLSVEPLFEPVRLDLTGIDWVIVGGGSDVLAEPFHVEWALDLYAECNAAGAAFFFKQLGKNPFYQGKPVKLDDRHGGDWTEWPSEWRVREFPEGFRTLTNSPGHQDCVELISQP